MRCLSKKAPCGSMSCWFIYTPHHLYSIWYIKVTIRGTLPYIYGYLNCIRSSRKLEKECFRNVEVMWLLKKLAPDHKTIADFRKNNAAAIKKVFKEFVLFSKELDLYGGEVVSIDGSKYKAVNSKKRNFNAEKLLRKLKDIEEKIEAYLKELEEND